jgi:hypothetical protein
MARYTNISNGLRVLAGGRAIAHGETVEFSKEELAHPVLRAWIDARHFLNVDAEAAADEARQAAEDEARRQEEARKGKSS